MIRTIFSRTDIFLLFVIFITFLSSLILTICNCIKKAIIPFALATILLILFLEEYYNKHKFFHSKKSIKKPSKIANQQSHSESSPTSSQETRQYLQLPKTPKHLHEFLSKITHTLLKNDTLAYLNH